MIGYDRLRVRPLDRRERLEILTVLAGATFTGEIPGVFVTNDLSRVRITATPQGCRVDRTMGGKAFTDSFSYKLDEKGLAFLMAGSTADIPVPVLGEVKPPRSQLLEENDGDELLLSLDPRRRLHLEKVCDAAIEQGRSRVKQA